MALKETDEAAARKPLRLWPGVLFVVLQWVAWFGIPALAPAAAIPGLMGGLACGLVVIVWWLFFSRARWFERLGAIVLIVAAIVATSRLVDESISNGMMGLMLPIYAIPVMSLALVVWVVATRRFSDGLRRVSMIGAFLLGGAVMTLVRTGGVTGDSISELHWRWTPTPEQRLLAASRDELAVPLPPPVASKVPAPPPAAATGDKTASLRPASEAATVEPGWPGFRGPDRDGAAHGARIATDWSVSPPVELWRRPIGPGWSSFAVRGDLLYTQEQRGNDEIVACYRLTTGQPVWRHRDAARFWESNAGAGPRSTPTLSDGRVYTFGATGIANALDAANGAVVWSRNAASDTGVKVPTWGFASSPVVVDQLVIIAAAGQLLAYDAATGASRWSGPADSPGYSSPHMATIDGVKQVLLLNGTGLTSVALADGTLLWKYAWPGAPILQPAQVEGGDLLLSVASASGGVGVRRIAVSHGPGGWTTEERWTSVGLKPYFNDFVVHKGHAFGFDGGILSCIDLADGKRLWKGGRYGHGQLIVLPEQDVLLVLSEEGEVALVKADPGQYAELGKFKAIEGKTWNHPVLVGDILLVRNDHEMAAFRLPPAGR